MQFPRRDDPTDWTDPEGVAFSRPGIPRPLLWGLAKGVIMLAVVAGLTWVAAVALQTRAREEGETALARARAPHQQAQTPSPGR
jgi:hypothetical protein